MLCPAKGSIGGDYALAERMRCSNVHHCPGEGGDSQSVYPFQLPWDTDHVSRERAGGSRAADALYRVFLHWPSPDPRKSPQSGSGRVGEDKRGGRERIDRSRLESLLLVPVEFAPFSCRQVGTPDNADELPSPNARVELGTLARHVDVSGQHELT